MGLAVVEKLSNLEHRRAILRCGSHPLSHPTQCLTDIHDCGGVTTVSIETPPRARLLVDAGSTLHYQLHLQQMLSWTIALLPLGRMA